MTRTINLIAKAGGLLVAAYVAVAVAVECASWRSFRKSG